MRMLLLLVMAAGLAGCADLTGEIFHHDGERPNAALAGQQMCRLHDSGAAIAQSKVCTYDCTGPVTMAGAVVKVSDACPSTNVYP